MKTAVIVLLLLSFVAQGVSTTLPVSLLMLLLSYVVFRGEWVFIVGLFGGIIIDVITANRIGYSSMYLMGFLLVVSLYERKFEVQTREFVFIASLVGSIVYFLLFAGKTGIVESVITALCGVGLFEILTYFSIYKRKEML